MGYLNWWNFPRKAWLIILGELIVIASLSVSLFLTYLNDVYFQSYANSLSPVLVPILSVAFGISSASIATYLYLGMKRLQIERSAEHPGKRKTHHTKTSNDPLPDTASASKNENSPQELRAKLKPMAPMEGHSRVKLPPRKKEEQAVLPETGKQS